MKFPAFDSILYVHYKRVPLVLILGQINPAHSLQTICPRPRRSVPFRNTPRFYGEARSALRPTPEMEGHPLSVVRHGLLIIFPGTFHIFTFMLPCIVIDFFLNNQSDALIIQIYSVINLYMSRACSLPITRSSLLYIRQW